MKGDDKTQLIKHPCTVDFNNLHLLLIADTCVHQHEEVDVNNMIGYRFVLLVYIILYYKPHEYISMSKYNGNIIDITGTVARLGNKSSNIMPVHVFP